MALYDPKEFPEAETVSPDFTLTEFLEWARTKPADESYDVDDSLVCALGQFGTATGRDSLHNLYDPERHLGFTGLNNVLGFDVGRDECRFGKLVARLEQALAR